MGWEGYRYNLDILEPGVEVRSTQGCGIGCSATKVASSFSNRLD